MRTFMIFVTVVITTAACLDQPPRPGPGPGVDAFVPHDGSGSGFDAFTVELEHSGSDGISAGAGDVLDHTKANALVHAHRRATGLCDDHQLLDHR